MDLNLPMPLNISNSAHAYLRLTTLISTAILLPDQEGLAYVKGLKSNVTMVSGRGEEFGYKFMIPPQCYQNTFETELENYQKLKGLKGLLYLF